MSRPDKPKKITISPANPEGESTGDTTHWKKRLDGKSDIEEIVEAVQQRRGAGDSLPQREGVSLSSSERQERSSEFQDGEQYERANNISDNLNRVWGQLTQEEREVLRDKHGMPEANKQLTYRSAIDEWVNRQVAKYIENENIPQRDYFGELKKDLDQLRNKLADSVDFLQLNDGVLYHTSSNKSDVTENLDKLADSMMSKNEKYEPAAEKDSTEGRRLWKRLKRKELVSSETVNYIQDLIDCGEIDAEDFRRNPYRTVRDHYNDTFGDKM